MDQLRAPAVLDLLASFGWTWRWVWSREGNLTETGKSKLPGRSSGNDGEEGLPNRETADREVLSSVSSWIGPIHLRLSLAHRSSEGGQKQKPRLPSKTPPWDPCPVQSLPWAFLWSCAWDPQHSCSYARALKSQTRFPLELGVNCFHFSQYVNMYKKRAFAYKARKE